MDTNMKWYLTKPEGTNALVLMKTARRIEGPTAVPFGIGGNPAAVLRSFRAEHYPLGVVIDLEPLPVDRWLPARLAKRFDVRLWDLRWTDDGTAFVPVRLRWHDDASYIAYQSDCGDDPNEPDAEWCAAQAAEFEAGMEEERLKHAPWPEQGDDDDLGF